MSKSDAGKGDDPRKNFDYKKFWTNFELISGVPYQGKPKYKKVIVKNGKTTYVF